MIWKDEADAHRLVELVAGTSNAKQRDRYRVVLIAGRGLGAQAELERERIAQVVGRSRQFVDQWVGRYRKGGIQALTPKRQPVPPMPLRSNSVAGSKAPARWMTCCWPGRTCRG